MCCCPRTFETPDQQAACAGQRQDARAGAMAGGELAQPHNAWLWVQYRVRPGTGALKLGSGRWAAHRKKKGGVLDMSACSRHSRAL